VSGSSDGFALSRYKNILFLVAVLLVQVIGLAMQIRRPNPNGGDGKTVRLIRYWAISLMSPPEKVVHGTGTGVRGMWSNYLDLRHVRQQNQELRERVSRLQLEQAGLLEDARQGQRLQALLGFKEHYIYSTVPAEVIGTSGTDQSRILTIDKGSKDGLKPDMAVITPDGIVGKLRDVFGHTSQVLVISDQTSGAGVLLESTRLRGVLRGNALGQPQIINMLPDERVKPGERVITSGGDQIFPRGLPV
jgi:rod shape-determining protein MreC